MELLKFLSEKIKDELDMKDVVDTADDASEKPEEDNSEKSGSSRVKIETDSKIMGIIRNVHYDLKFKDLADRLTDEVSGVVVTRDKAKKIFKIVKDIVGF